jgi:hypothetical protein
VLANRFCANRAEDTLGQCAHALHVMTLTTAATDAMNPIHCGRTSSKPSRDPSATRSNSMTSNPKIHSGARGDERHLHAVAE